MQVFGKSIEVHSFQSDLALLQNVTVIPGSRNQSQTDCSFNQLEASNSCAIRVITEGK